jgi:hypothetical protein
VWALELDYSDDNPEEFMDAIHEVRTLFSCYSCFEIKVDYYNIWSHLMNGLVVLAPLLPLLWLVHVSIY